MHSLTALNSIVFLGLLMEKKLTKRMRKLIEEHIYGIADYSQYKNSELDHLDGMIADDSIDAFRIKISKDRYPDPGPGRVLFYADRYAIAIDKRILVNGKIQYPASAFIEKNLKIQELELLVGELQGRLEEIHFSDESSQICNVGSQNNKNFWKD